jgi:hypothetical protein
MHPMSAQTVHTTSGDEVVSLPVVPESYRFPLATRVTFVLGVILFLGLALAAPLLWPGEAELWIGQLIFLGFGLLSALCVWLSQQYVTVDAQGITWRSWGRAARHIEWNQLREARARSTAQTLELHGLPGEPVIKVPFFIKDFARLRGLVAHAAAKAGIAKKKKKSRDLPVTFRANRAYFVVTYLMAALFALTGLGGLLFPQVIPADSWSLVGCLALALLFAGTGGWHWRSLTVDADRLVLRALLRHREIFLSDVASAEIETVVLSQAGISGRAQMRLVVLLKNGKQLRLSGMGEARRACEVIEAARKAGAQP